LEFEELGSEAAHCLPPLKDCCHARPAQNHTAHFAIVKTAIATRSCIGIAGSVMSNGVSDDNTIDAAMHA